MSAENNTPDPKINNPDPKTNSVTVKNNPPVKKDEEEVVTVSKSLLESIQKTLAGYQQEIADLKKGQSELEKTASPDQIKKIEAMRASGKLVKSVKISYIDGQLVEKWRSAVDEVYIDNTGKEISKQTTVITYFDGKEKEYNQVDFARRKTYKEYEVITEAKDRDGELILTVMTEDGKEIKINSRFIN
jgi:vacuolar-type H+-ATPase subunit I/STV1